MESADIPELRVSNEVRNDIDELRRRLDEDGYLFFRQLLDPDRLMKLRHEMLSVMQAGGWLVAGTDPMDGIADPDTRCTEGDLGYTDVYHKVYKLQSFHAIAHSRKILDLLEEIRGCTMMPQPQKVARLWFPKFTEHTTPTHQDFVHFQGPEDNLTCWTPVGDCPRELGGLAVLRGSHKVGRVLQHRFSLGAGSLHVEPSEHDLSDEWRTTDYQVGDALIFPFLTIHKALPNVSADRLRVSLDNRYQRAGDPIADHMLMPHLSSMSPLTWEEVYEDWQDDAWQYYWRAYESPVWPKITHYMEQAFDQAADLARQGDARGRLHLHRIATRDAMSEQGQAAATILAEIDSASAGRVVD